MYLPDPRDAAMRQEVQATLASDPGASCEAALGNWRYHQHGVISESEEQCIRAIYAEEKPIPIVSRPPRSVAGNWWKFWE
jgi:hypothetical protein